MKRAIVVCGYGYGEAPNWAVVPPEGMSLEDVGQIGDAVRAKIFADDLLEVDKKGKAAMDKWWREVSLDLIPKDLLGKMDVYHEEGEPQILALLISHGCEVIILDYV